MRELTRVGMHSRTLMEWVLRIMANLLRPDELGAAEAAYAAVEVIVRALPDPAARGGHGPKPPSRGPQVVPIVR